MDVQTVLKGINNYQKRKGINDYTDYMYIQNADQDNSEIAIIANWNNLPDKLYSVLEYEFDLYYDDEIYMCTECGKLINNHPNGWGWERNAILDPDYGYICLDCIYDGETLETVLDSYSNNPDIALPSYCDVWLKNLGYTRVNEDVYLNGLHRGMADSPKQILDSLCEDSSKQSFVFVINHTSQFYLGFDLYKLED